MDSRAVATTTRTSTTRRRRRTSSAPPSGASIPKPSSCVAQCPGPTGRAPASGSCPSGARRL